MRVKRSTRSHLLLATLVLATVSPARADVFHDVGTGLAFAGFDVRGNHNPLSGGADLLITNTFDGSPFDFGAADISFQGPVSLQVSTGGRYLSQFDVSLTTAVDNRSTPSPLNYVFNYDVGGQSTRVSGSALVNADFSLNGFGFYKLSVDYSSRQTVDRNGQVVTDQSEFDSNFGPITISGNVFTDVLAWVTDPLFEQTGQTNPFASLSPAARLINADPTQQQELLKALVALGDESSDPPSAFGRNGGAGLNDLPPELSLTAEGSNGRSFGLVVPEPPVLGLLLLGIPAILGRFGLRTRR